MAADDGTVRAGWKLSWIEAVANDKRLTHLTIRVAVAVSSRADPNGVARTASQGWIAKRYGVTDRAVRDCLIRLCESGHLKRIKGGQRTREGGGRAAEYQLLKRAGEGGQSAMWQQPTEAAEDRKPASGRNVDDRKRGSEIPETGFQNTGSAVPPLPSSFQEFFQARVGARAPRGGQGKPGGPWLAIKELLARSDRIGQDKVASWFDKITLHSVIDGEMRLMAPTKFVARWVRDSFASQILAAWREIDPSARSVRIEHAARPALAARQEGANAAG